MTPTDPRIPVVFDENKIDAIFADLDQGHLPGVAVGIAIDGVPVYRKGFGLAHMELPVLLSPSIRMRIYSTTKHFNCLTYLLLCEEGKASIDDPIGKYVPELHPVSRDVTARQLMSNVGGLRNPMNLRWELTSGDRDVSVQDILSLYRDIDDINFPPNTDWNYNNSGFELIGAAVERIGGEPLEEALRNRIFEPVGMFDTLLRRTNFDFVPNSTTMHMVNSRGNFEKTYLPGMLAGAGGIVSTVDDMLLWLKHMDEPVIGSTESWALLTTPQTLKNGTNTGYAFGLQVDRYRGVRMISHSGGGLGANSQMIKVPSARLDVAMMLNRSDVYSVNLTKDILDTCLPTLSPVAPGRERAVPTGVFRSTSSERIVDMYRAEIPGAFVEQGDLVVSVNGTDYPMEFDKDGILRPKAIMSSTRYALDLSGCPAETGMVQFMAYGNIEMLEPVECISTADATRVIGEYWCKSLATEASIYLSDEGTCMKMAGSLGASGYRLEAIAKGVWSCTQMNITPRKSVLSFDEEAKSFGYLSFSTGGRALRFNRRS